MATALAALACSQRAADRQAMTAALPAPPPAWTAPVVVVLVPPGPPAPAVDPELLGTFRMTRYYVAHEAEFKRAPAPAVATDADGEADDGGGDGDEVLAATAPAATGVTIYDDRGCRPLATLGARFYEVMDVQGTGKLRDGRVVNVSSPCSCDTSPCYRVMPRTSPWGMSASMRPLQPFRTVAVDPEVVPLGTLLYIEELDGLTMPGQAPWGGFVHDGCVIAADVGGHIDGMHVDFFVGRYQYKKLIDRRRRMKYVTIYDGARRCADGARGWVAPRIGS
ncbi:MAG: hypothetical protein H6708_18380 [Kofleriaceae bacterium]|nr:hypothetical protein [Myxococcales bacterium]MCB9562377.1 hypothetical protein [Kofleriaceae bacterium]